MKKIIPVFFAMLPALVFAGALDQLDAAMATAVANITGDLQRIAIIWLSSFVLLQMLITNLGLMKSGAEIDAVLGKLVASLMWFGVCFYILENGPNFIDGLGKQFFRIASDLAGAGGFDAAAILRTGSQIAANLLAKINEHSHLTNLFLPAIIGGLVGVVILGTAALIAFKVFLIKVEAMLIVMLAPLSFAFLGLDALKDQGIAPFKAIISLIYRVLFLAVILKCMGIVSDNLVKVIDLINDDSIDTIWDSLFAASSGFLLLGFLAFKSDSLASNLASGSTSLGTGDVAAAAAMGGALGAMAGNAGAAAGAVGAKNPAMSMSDFIKNLGGGGTQVSNAGGVGSGGSQSRGGLDPMPMASVADAPKWPETPPSPFETGSRGQPLAPSQPSNVAAPGDGSAKVGGIAPAPGAPAPAHQEAHQETAWNKVGKALGNVGQHLQNEKAATHISINTHRSD